MRRVEIESQKGLERTSVAREGGFRPLATCPSSVPPTKRRRWEALGRQAGKRYRAAVELKCLECCAWSRPEARRCEIQSCALWAISARIFKRVP